MDGFSDSGEVSAAARAHLHNSAAKEERRAIARRYRGRASL
jgi:hypothetical protein